MPTCPNCGAFVKREDPIALHVATRMSSRHWLSDRMLSGMRKPVKSRRSVMRRRRREREYIGRHRLSHATSW